MNTAPQYLHDFTASEAVDEFNEDPIACIEQMIAADYAQKRLMTHNRWVAGWIDTKAYDAENALRQKQMRVAVIQAMKEIVSESWQSNDVRETSQSVRDQWLDKYVAFVGEGA